MPAVAQKRNNPITRSKLTPKQAIFVKEYVKSGGEGVKSALKAYDTDDYATANAIAVENLHKPSIYEEIQVAAARLNLTPGVVLENLQDVLTQRESLSCVVSSAQVINSMTGWQSPVKIDNTHRLGESEDGIIKSFD